MTTIKITWNQRVLLDRIIEMYEDDIIGELDGLDYVDEGATESQLLRELDELKRAVKDCVYE